MPSIIIPAHNEEEVIGLTLKALLPKNSSDGIDITVVCNGCTDNTATVAKSYGAHIRVVETTTPSKTNALNIGDSVANGFPRIYQDADVVFNRDSVNKLVRALSTNNYLAVSPMMKLDFHNASIAVRSYYQIWQQLPYVREGMVGVGVYALSQEGRKRFGQFPPIIADDGYVRCQFERNEMAAVPNCYSIVRTPQTLSGLVKIKTRSRLGGYELSIKFPELMRKEKNQYAAAANSFLQDMGSWPKIAIYLYVNLLSRILAKRHLKSVGFQGWFRDDTSRQTKIIGRP